MFRRESDRYEVSTSRRARILRGLSLAGIGAAAIVGHVASEALIGQDDTSAVERDVDVIALAGALGEVGAEPTPVVPTPLPVNGEPPQWFYTILYKMTGSCFNWQSFFRCRVCIPWSASDASIASESGGEESDYGNQYEYSRIDNTRLAHHHHAVDYVALEGTPDGCAPCGGQAQSGNGLERASIGVTALNLKRFHRYRDIHYTGSFGPAVFSSYDTFLNLSVSDQTVGSGTIRLFDPHVNFEQVLKDGDKDGVYDNNGRHRSIQSLTLFDGAGAVTADIRLAETAEMKRHDGFTFSFEIINPSNATNGRWGRLAAITDRNGIGTSLTYQHTPATTDARAWQIDVITDAFGRSLSFEYNGTYLGGRYLVDRIVTPNGPIDYAYNLNGLGVPEEGSWPITGLSGVSHLDGSQTTVGLSHNTDFQLQMITYDDPAAGGTHRRKTVGLSLSDITLPDASVLDVTGRTVRMVLDGDGELTYLNWIEAADGAETKYIYNQQTVYRWKTVAGYPLGADRADNVDWTTGPSNWNWTPVESLTHDVNRRITSKTDGEGNKTTLSLRNSSGAVMERTFADNTSISYQRNGFQQITLMTDELGRQVETIYDVNGNRRFRTVAFGTADAATTEWLYNAAGQVVEVREPNYTAAFPDLHSTKYIYSTPAAGAAIGYLTEIHEAADIAGGARPITILGRDTVGRLVSQTDPVGRLTGFAYDNLNRPTVTTYADTSTDVTTWETTGVNAGLVVATTDRNGRVTSLGYDGHGRRTEVRRGVGLVGEQLTTIAYREGSDLVARRTVDGDATDYTYDAWARRVGTTVYPADGESLASTTLLDDASRPVVLIDAYGRASIRIYDVRNRVTKTVTELIPGSVLGAFGSGPIDLAVIDALVRDTSLNPGYVINQTEYDAASQRVAAIDGRALRSEVDYDQQGRPTHRRAAVGTTDAIEVATTYDANSNVISVSDPYAVGSAPDAVAVTSYTGRNLVASTLAGADPVTETATDISLETTFSYNLDATIHSRTVAPGTDEAGTWLTIWGDCCKRVVAQIAPPTTGSTDLPAGTPALASVTQWDYVGNMTHTAQVELTAAEYAAIQSTGTAGYDWMNPDDSRTLSESITEYDARNRVIAQHAMADTPLGAVDPNNAAAAIGVLPVFTTGIIYTDTPNPAAADADGSVVAVTNPEGETTTTTRDGLGRTLTTVDAEGTTAEVAYDVVTANGLLETTQTVDPAGLALTSISRADAAGRVREAVDAEGFQSDVRYDANGNLVESDDRLDHLTVFGYDFLDRRTSTLDAVGVTTTVEYDAEGNITVQTDGEGGSTGHIYDARDRRVWTTDRLGNQTFFAYDRRSNLREIADDDALDAAGLDPATAAKTIYTYDERSQLIEDEFPDQDGRQYAYDGLGRLITRRDQQGVSTAYRYDLPGRLLSREYTGPSATAPSVDVFTYDDANRLLSATSGLYAVACSRTYRDNGQLDTETTSIDGASYTIIHQYDTAARMTGCVYPSGATVTKALTGRSQIDTLTRLPAGGGAATQLIDIDYDAAQREVSRTLGNSVTETRIWRDDNLLQSISAPGVIDLAYTYDDNKRKTFEADAVLSSFSASFTYDAEDRLTDYLRASGSPADPSDLVVAQSWTLTGVGDWDDTTIDGVVQDRDFNAVHEITAIDGQVLTHDVKGNLTTNPGRASVYRWDDENRLIEALVDNNSADGSVAFTMPAGASDVLAIESEAAVRVEPSTVGLRWERVPSAQASGGATLRVSPDMELYPNWSTQAGRLDFDIDFPAAGTYYLHLRMRSETAAGTNPGQDDSVHVGLNGTNLSANISWGTTNNSKQTWSWVSKFSSTGDRVTITVPSAGTHTVNVWMREDGTEFDKLLVTADETLSWGSSSFGPAATSEVTHTAYRYDALGRRVQKSVAGAVTTFISAGAQVFAEYDGTGALTREYVYGAYVDEPVAVIDANGDILYYHHDHRYSVTALTDESGAVVERYGYDAYGNSTVLDATGSVERDEALQPYRTTGRRYDDETGLHYFRARYFDAGLGRFIGRDSRLGLPGWGFVIDPADPSQIALYNTLQVAVGGAGGYRDGLSLYAGYFMSSQLLDPMGNEEVDPDLPPPVPEPPRDVLSDRDAAEAWLTEVLGKAADRLSPSPGVATIASLVDDCAVAQVWLAAVTNLRTRAAQAMDMDLYSAANRLHGLLSRYISDNCSGSWLCEDKEKGVVLV